MKQHKHYSRSRGYSQLTYSIRQKIEAKFGRMSLRQMARELEVNVSTISREIKLGMTEQLSTKVDPIAVVVYGKREHVKRQVYSADVAQCKRDWLKSGKGCREKLGNSYAFVSAVAKLLRAKYSPTAALIELRRRSPELMIDICPKTLYNYIHNGWIDGITAKDLLEKHKKRVKVSTEQRLAHNNRKGLSIEKRPEAVNNRLEVGHWEFDLVVGKQGTKCVLLTMIERVTRRHIIIKLPNKKQKTIIEAFNKLERKYGAKRFRSIFKSMTCDNGSEFLNFEALESSCINKRKKRTTIYYCHPYASYERGSNENGNRFIRRFIPKGHDIKKWSSAQIKEIESFINNYPRQILNYNRSNDLSLGA